MNINTTNINMKNDNTQKSLSSNQNTEVTFSDELEELEKNQSTENLYNPHVLATCPRIGTIRKNHIQSRFTSRINLLYLIALNLTLS